MFSVISARRLLAALVGGSLMVLGPFAVTGASAAPRHHHHHHHHHHCHHRGCHGHYWSRTATTTGVGVRSHVVSAGAHQVASVAVRTASGAKATGTVRITVTGHGTRTVALSRGRATFVLPTKQRGIFEVSSSYAGDNQHVASTSSSSYIVAS